MRYLFSSLIGYLLLFSACIKEDRADCSSDRNESEVLVRITGDYTSTLLSKLDLWIEMPNHDNWYRVKHYSEVEIAGKDYVKIMLPVGQPCRFVALGNALSSSMVVAPLPQDQDDTHPGNNPSDHSMVRYMNNGAVGMPIDNLLMSMPVSFQNHAFNAPQKVDVPIDGIVSLVKLRVKCPAMIGMQADVTLFNSSEGVMFNSRQLPVHLPVRNSAIIDKDEYTLNTIIFPSFGSTSDIRILVEVKDLSTGEYITFEQNDIHISPKQVYVITFDGITFNIEVADWDGSIDIDSEINQFFHL